MKRIHLLLPLLILTGTAPLLSAETPILHRLGPFGGDVRSLAQHPQKPDRIFLGTADGQIYISETRGRNWERLVPGIGRRNAVVDNLVFDPEDPNLLYAAGWELKSNRGWLYRTRDGGNSWEAIDLANHNSSVRALAVAPTNSRALAVGISEGVLLSLDEGQTWERISRGYRSLHNVHSLAFDPADHRRLYVGTWRLAWRTDDLGENWQAIHQGMYWDSDLFTLLVDPRDTSTVYASACSGVWKSKKSGASWTKLNNGLSDEARRTRVLRFDPSNPDILYAGTTIGLYHSVDAGASWKNLLENLVINAILVDPHRGNRLIVGTEDAGILISEDGGRQFEPANSGFVHRQISSLAYSARSDHLYASVSMDREFGGFYYSTDRGKHWIRFNDGLADQIGRIQSILTSQAADQVWLATRNGIFQGIPASQKWKRLQGTGSLQVNDLTFVDSSEDRLLAATPRGVFAYNLATEKIARIEIPIYDREIFSLHRDQASGLIFAGSDMGVFRSDDQGSHWELKVNGFPYVTVTVLASIEGTIFAGTTRGLFRSEDLGETWIECQGIYPIELTAISGDESKIFAADLQAGYLFVSSDGGRTFSSRNMSDHASRISALVLIGESQLVAGTLSEGVLGLEYSRPASTYRSGSSPHR